MAKICCIIQIKLNQFKKISIWSLTYQQSIFKHYHSDKHFSEFLPTRWWQKSSGIDMEQNYITVTPCICQIKITVMVTRINECSYSYMNIQHPHLTRITYCAWSLVVNIYFPVFLYPDFLYIHIFSILVITNSTESVFNPVRQIVPDIDSSDRHCSW